MNNGQTIFDSTLQLTGDVTNALAMAALNGLSLTDSIQDIVLIPAGTVRRGIVAGFVNNVPASLQDATDTDNGMVTTLMSLPVTTKGRNQQLVLQGQTFFDKTLELTGDVTNALAMAALNSLSLTDSLSIGTAINGTGVTDAAVVSLFVFRPPASTLQLQQLSNLDYLLPQLFPFL